MLSSPRTRRNADFFGTFLETCKIAERGELRRGRTLIRIIDILNEQGSQPITRLMENSAIEATDFLEAIKTLKTVGLISLIGRPGCEIVELTDNGRQIADFAQ